MAGLRNSQPNSSHFLFFLIFFVKLKAKSLDLELTLFYPLSQEEQQQEEQQEEQEPLTKIYQNGVH